MTEDPDQLEPLRDNDASARFARVSPDYCKHRFDYPVDMVRDVVELCEERDLALDCGTGTGQVPRMLHDSFEQVVAIDRSEEQINHAYKAENVTYRVNAAENLSFLEDESVDLITVGTAFHWFEQESFLKEAKRVLKKGGVLAMFGVRAPEVAGGERVFGDFLNEKVAPHLSKSKNRGVLELGEIEGFEQIDFPPTYFESMKREVEDLTGWVRTTSAWPILVEIGEADSVLAELRGRLAGIQEEGSLDVVSSAYIKVFKKL